MPLPSRRTVLKWSLASGALVLGTGTVLALQKTRLREPTPKLSVFDPASYAVLAALADRLCPPLGKGAPGAAALGVPATIDAMLVPADDAARKQLTTAITMLENALGGALFGERLVPFTQLDAAGQEAALVNLRDSSVGVRRTLFHALSGLVFAVYWSNPQTWERIGYGGPESVAKLREMYRDNLVDLDSLRATPLAQGA
jgi:Gluconate 2-dehydrogenase subunit 3